MQQMPRHPVLLVGDAVALTPVFGFVEDHFMAFLTVVYFGVQIAVSVRTLLKKGS